MALFLRIGVMPCVLAFIAFQISTQDKRDEQRSNVCHAEFPLSVALDRAERVVNLQSTDFDIRLEGQRAPPLGVTPDGGRRRILILLQGGKHVSKEAWELKTLFAGYVAAKVRPQDRLALLVTGGSEKPIGFEESNATAVAELSTLTAPLPTPDGKGQAVYDALMEGLTLFGKPQFGDSVFFFGQSVDVNSKVRREDVEREMQKRGVRLYGFLYSAFAMQSHLHFSLPTSENLPLREEEVNDSELGILAENTGGALTLERVDVTHGTYRLTPQRRESLEQLTLNLLTHILLPYRITAETSVKNSSPSLKINLSRGTHKKMPDAIVLYPHRTPSCTEGSLIRPAEVH